MTNQVTMFETQFDLRSLVLAIQRSTQTYIKSDSKFLDDIPAETKTALEQQHTTRLPVVSLHEGKYVVLMGDVTTEMKANGFKAIFVSKYNLNKARVANKEPTQAPAVPVEPAQAVQQLQERFSPTPRYLGKKYHTSGNRR